MSFLLTTGVLLVLSYYASFLVILAKNYLKARKTGFPIVICPVDHHHVVWMILSQPMRPLLKRFLPEGLYNRLALCIYGWEYQERRIPFQRLQTSSFMMVTCGENELVTIDPEMLSDIMKRPTEFNRHAIGNAVLNVFGTSVITSEGEAWARQRKLITAIINERISRVVFDESWRQGRAMSKDIEGSILAMSKLTTDGQVEVADDQFKANNQSVYPDTFPALKKIAINVLFRSAYGTPQSFKEMKQPQLNEASQGTEIKLDMFECISAVLANLAAAAFLPKKLLIRWPSFLPASHWAHHLGTAVDQFPPLMEQRLDRERQELANLSDGQSRNNLMSMMLQASQTADDLGKEKVQAMNGKAQSTLSGEELRGNLFIFTTAGFETTANTLTFAFVAMMAQTKIQDWLFEEIDELFNKNPTTKSEPADSGDDTIDYVTFFPKAIRCLALMMETLRVYPPILGLSRDTVKQTETKVIKTSKGTYYVPPRTGVNGPMAPLHTDPKVWRNLNMYEGVEATKEDSRRVVETMEDVLDMTQDEYVFRPSRWESKELKQMPDGTMSKALFSPPKGTFIPFIAGPRVCPGQKMAQVEFVCVILSLFKDYRIEAVKKPGESETQMQQRLQSILKDCHAEVTLVMDRLNEVEVRFIKRKRS